MNVSRFKKMVLNTTQFFLYGVVFALITYVTSLLPSGSNYTHTPPVALADHSGGDGGPQDGGADGCAGDGGGGDGSCDGP